VGERPTSAIWLVATDGGAARPLTDGQVADTSLCWSPDGAYLAFLSDRRERGVPQLSHLSLATGEVIALTDHPAGVSYPAWSPDGALLAYLAREKDVKGDATSDRGADRDGARDDARDDARVVDRDEPGNALWALDLADAAATRRPIPRRLSPEGMHVGS